jgi:flagellar hook assembly protein FlgD
MFDSGLEHFTVQLTAGAPGNHLLEFQAWNSSGVGVAVPASTVLTVNAAGPIDGGAAVPAAATLEAAPNPAVGAIGLRVRGPAGRSGVARVFDPAGRLVRAWRIQTSAAGEASWVWDGRRERGGERAGGVYFLRVELGSERLTRRIVLFR